MTEASKSRAGDLFNREHLVVIVGTLLISIHIIDELIRGESLAPPFIPLIVVAVIYSFLPRAIRAIAVGILGGIFFIAQILGHLIPVLQNGPTGSDYTGIFPMIGGAILVGLTVQVLKKRSEN